MPRALLSVTDKTGITELAVDLVNLGFEILSTGGTAAALRSASIPAIEIADVTGFPEMLDGRVKTLHPAVHGGLLADRMLESHRAQLESAGIVGIDVLAVNLYKFEQTVRDGCSVPEAIESIDIGGPAMIRAAAKNNRNVTVLVDPADYATFVERSRAGGVDDSMRLSLAAKAFRHTAYYDSMIARYLTGAAGDSILAETLTMGWKNDSLPLRYGENPHQVAARFVDPLSDLALRFVPTEGAKEISYNNWLDADAAWNLVSDLPEGSCAIIKHGNPCGAASASDLGESYRFARASDPISAFGGIVALKGKIDKRAVDAMTEKGNFLEVVVSNGWSSEQCKEAFFAGSPWTRNVRFVEAGESTTERQWTIRTLRGAALVQMEDFDTGEADWAVATDRQPSNEEWDAIRFLWKVVPHVKSNAILVGLQNRLLGVGAGQMNRVQSTRLALEQAGDAATGAVLASDAFFPFPDSIEVAARSGISAIVQPGGSKKDGDVIAAANEFGMAMVLTGTRHFRH